MGQRGNGTEMAVTLSVGGPGMIELEGQIDVRLARGGL